jgi:hypothetical protein
MSVTIRYRQLIKRVRTQKLNNLGYLIKDISVIFKSFLTAKVNRLFKILNILRHSLRRSMSDFCMEKTSTSCRPSYSSPIRSGRNSTSGARNLNRNFLNHNDLNQMSKSSNITVTQCCNVSHKWRGK